jgi:hypothetical protein
MRGVRLAGVVLMASIVAPACVARWERAPGVQVLPEIDVDRHVRSVEPATDPTKAGGSDSSYRSRRLYISLPEGWNQVWRESDLFASRDGVFLQHILVERIHVDQTGGLDGRFSLATISSKQWPVRTVPYLKKRLAPGMSPSEVAEVLLESRRNNPGISDLAVGEVVPREVAGHPGFMVAYDFRVTVASLKTPYRTIYCGFLKDGWLYGISYTAARRYYFERDVGTFEAAMPGFRVVE